MWGIVRHKMHSRSGKVKPGMPSPSASGLGVAQLSGPLQAGRLREVNRREEGDSGARHAQAGRQLA